MWHPYVLWTHAALCESGTRGVELVFVVSCVLSLKPLCVFVRACSLVYVEWCGCDVLFADTSCVAICCLQLATLRQVYSVKYHDTQLNTVCWIRGECITSILIRESMMCSLDTDDVRNCSACTCAVQIGWNACVFVCVYGGTQRALAMRLFTRVWEVSSRALGPPDPFPLLNLYRFACVGTFAYWWWLWSAFVSIDRLCLVGPS